MEVKMKSRVEMEPTTARRKLSRGGTWMRNGTVALFVALSSTLLLCGAALAHISTGAFLLSPQTKFLPCFQASGLSTVTSTAQVFVSQGPQNDTLVLFLRGFKPGLDFDLFTVENTNLNSNGTLNTGFKTPPGFGLAWYQSDVRIDTNGQALVSVVSKFVDEIFGFDPGASLAPTHAFHVGIWFDSPADAASCGFSGITPFNGSQNAGPNAMISVPNKTTGLGPLCLNPIGVGKCTP
jgi:hypothetical protein